MKFIFGIHNHQPVGNFDFVFEEAYQNSYRPFIEMVERFSFLHFSLHVSGPLIDWLEVHHPEYFDAVSRLVESKRVEMISSGYYEPILASISDSDKIGQIEMMNDFIQRRFGVKPEGLWLTERVWEPGLVKPISLAGIKYVAVDDTHFSTSGIPMDKLNGYYLTEDQGYVLGVFPISQKLRYTIPFSAPEESIKIFNQHAIDDQSVMVMADDGEKFGVWPGSNELCYGEENWMERFLISLEDNSHIVDTTTFSQAFHNSSSRGRIYLPTSSYFEMGEWTLTPKSSEEYNLVNSAVDSIENMNGRSYVKGGFWRNFLTKYDESNWMLKRANAVSANLPENASSSARESSWKAQCNCAYWHGVFGGLYLPHLRHALYSNLIAAEKSINYEPVEEIDIDHDGKKEIILSGKSIRLFLTCKGGAIREMDFLPADFNLINTLSRYEEYYHKKLHELNNGKKSSGTASIHDLVQTKEDGLENFLHYDKNHRWSFMDHFFKIDTTLDELYSGSFEDIGDLPNQYYTRNIQNGDVDFNHSADILQSQIEICKNVKLEDNKIKLQVSITNNGNEFLHIRYGCEFNISLLGGHSFDRYYLVDGQKPVDPYLDSKDSFTAKTISLVTEWEKIKTNIILPKTTSVFRYPVETISMSEGGFERIYQSSVVVPNWELKLAPGDKFKTTIELVTKEL
ncbi:MAG: DUF1926 domain-containing protein [Candidatus Marinimicrobia bacterium]|jgi:alpha-amylase|nr:DUF1926 domain-containing protein [Candidatus Neomarinimicrobiota bacterium]MBT3633321.1 DUF1926 domain-containing protein [Candidatus Neomarinimicrobiota bacterium]MBT3681464.1 DUF1926 domain-containing protein [Candidatus Neomarinimicrobiota bacterium]MBT3758569.1 DUF1926 domain-containing protein [Candidatus Neomarinimicrobiota bacterium]MBT3894777.1 DUF1926 domain-containing protein [Candidatus Neomarinimicrobiota bacterium]